MGIVYDKLDKMVFRVGCLLPLTPWYVVFHYLGLPDYNRGRHSANALFSVASHLFNVNLAFGAIALVAILCGDADDDIKKIAAVLVVLHFFFFDYFLLSNSVSYA